MTWSLLDDPEPPPHPWWIRALGGASVLAIVASSIVAGVGVGGTHQRNVAAETPATAPASTCDLNKGRELQSLGATVGDWETSHTAAYAPFGTYGERWNPSPRLPRLHGHPGAVYNKTLPLGDCTIGSFYIQLAQGTSATVALQRARRELPTDARVVWHRSLHRCAQYEFVSKTLDSQLRQRAPNFGATSALVRLIESRPGDATSVTRVALALNDAPPPADAGGCAL